MPEAVRLVASDDEWTAFVDWRAKPKPKMLDQHDQFPDVPHDLADRLFARLIERLRQGKLVAFGRWGQRAEFEEIDPMHWGTSWYNIWFNELGFADGGRCGFSAIYLEDRPQTAVASAKPQTRAAIRGFLDDWRTLNPNGRITKPAMLKLAKAALAPAHDVTENIFEGVWRNAFPDRNKYTGRPPSSSK